MRFQPIEDGQPMIIVRIYQSLRVSVERWQYLMSNYPFPTNGSDRSFSSSVLSLIYCMVTYHVDSNSSHYTELESKSFFAGTAKVYTWINAHSGRDTCSTYGQKSKQVLWNILLKESKVVTLFIEFAQNDLFVWSSCESSWQRHFPSICI